MGLSNEMATELLNSLESLDSSYERSIETVAILTDLLDNKHDLQPVVVGELARQYYSSRKYSTNLADLVISDTKIVDELLKGLGFVRKSGYYEHQVNNVSISIPKHSLGESENNVLSVIVGGGLRVYMMSLNDIILDCIRSASSIGSIHDRKWGIDLLTENANTIDAEYILSHCQNNKEREEFAEWLTYTD